MDTLFGLMTPRLDGCGPLNVYEITYCRSITSLSPTWTVPIGILIAVSLHILGAEYGFKNTLVAKPLLDVEFGFKDKSIILYHV